MKIYNYSKVTGAFINECDAKLDPVEEKPLIPICATTEPPPKNIPSGSVAVRTGGEWVVKTDNRGKQLYRKDNGAEEIKCKTIDVPSHLTDKKPFTNNPYLQWDEDNEQWTENAERRKQWNDEQAKDNLQLIDVASVRAIREYISKQSDAPQILIDREAEAVSERKKLS